jgi:UDP-glucose 4-epimerase
MSRVLVTGGLGFVGHNLIKVLVDVVDYVYCIDNNFTSIASNKIDRSNVEYIYGDTRDIFRLMKDKRVDIVYHLGEYSRITTSFEDIDLVHDFNTEGTFKVLRFCQDREAKLIYAASSSKFGDIDNQHLSPYAWMKAKNVELIKNFSRWFGLNYSIAYFFNVYGSGQILKGKYSAVIGRFMDQFSRGEKLTVVYPGTQRRDFTNVEDIVEGLIMLLYKGDRDEFQFGTGESYSIIDIAEAFNCEYAIVPERKGERFAGRALEDDSIKRLGWAAKNNVIDYIKNFIKSRNNG